MPVSKQTLDSKEIFHDIKPLPEFHPLPLGWILGFLILLLLYLLYRQRKKSLTNKLKLQIPTGLNPKDLALEQLKLLNEMRLKKELPLRELSSRISLVQRTYLEKVLNFNACEQTVYELTFLLAKMLIKKLPQTPIEVLEKISDQLQRNLRLLDSISFGNKTADIYTFDSSELIAVLESSKEVILEIEAQLLLIEQSGEKNNGV